MVSVPFVTAGGAERRRTQRYMAVRTGAGVIIATGAAGAHLKEVAIAGDFGRWSCGK